MPDLFDDGLIGILPFLSVVYVLFPLFPLLYVIIRWRAGGGPEPGLGLRAAMHYFRAVSTLVVITAVALLLHSVLSPDVDRNSMEDLRRVGGGLLVGGGLFLGVMIRYLRFHGSGDRNDPAERVCTGSVLLVAGTGSLVTILVVFVILFGENLELDDIRAPLAWLLVWTVAFLIHIRLLQPRADRSGSAPRDAA